MAIQRTQRSTPASNIPIKIAFTGFWPGFSANENYFVKMLDCPWELSSDPQVTICSCFDMKHRKYENSLKIYFTGENIRPNMFEYDYAASFDLDEKNGRCIRWPLYNLYFDPKFEPMVGTRDKFCCMVVSNPKNDKRIDFFHSLGKFKKIDSGGKTLNNVGGPVLDKMDFIKNYKFCIAFENAYFPGYTTEKLLEAKKAGCIPIYWGNPYVSLDFNTESFVNAHEFKSFSDCIEFIRHLDADDTEYRKMQSQPLLRNNEYTRYSDISRFRNWINTAISKDNRRGKSYFFSWCTDKLNRIKTGYMGKIGERSLVDDTVNR